MDQHTTQVSPFYVAVARYYQAHCGCGWSSQVDYSARGEAEMACEQHTSADHSAPVSA
jgi:hypothetical protein